MAPVLRFLLWPVLGGLLAALAIILLLPAAKPPAGNAAVTLSPAAAKNEGGSGPVSYADAVARAAPAVVNIYTSKTIETPVNPLFADPNMRRYFGGAIRVPKQKRMESSLGSGVIVSDKGYVLTNNPVAAIFSHIAMHIAGVLQGPAPVIQLLSHY